MSLTRSEFCQFNLATRLALAREFGTCILQRRFRNNLLLVYRVHDFHIEIHQDLNDGEIYKVEPVISPALLAFYRSVIPVKIDGPSDSVLPADV